MEPRAVEPQGARVALAPLKFAEGGLAPFMLWPYNTDCLLK